MFGFSLGIFFLFVVEKSKMIAHAVKRATAIEGPSGAIPVGCPFSVSFDGIFIHIRVVVPLAVVRPHMIHTEPEVVPELRGGPWRTEFTGQVATRVFAASFRRRMGGGFGQKFVEVDFFAPTCHVGNMSAGCAGRKDACAVV